MAEKVLLRRGAYADLPVSGLTLGEPLFSTDRGVMHVATAADATLTVAPAVEELTALAAGEVSSANDLILIHDASVASGRKEKKITFADFKTALSIPAASSDEYVKVNTSGASGYLGDGSDGVLRVDTTLAVAVDASNDFLTLSVGTVDCGSFA